MRVLDCLCSWFFSVETPSNVSTADRPSALLSQSTIANVAELEHQTLWSLQSAIVPLSTFSQSNTINILVDETFLRVRSWHSSILSK
ncbi:hypothetical protein IWZ01DRAFT_553720 [Phyllosticta capitalensis]